MPRLPKPLMRLITSHLVEPKLSERTRAQIKREPQCIEGGNVVELDSDMLTVKG